MSDLKGGAAIAAYRLHRALLARDVESGMYVMQRSASEPEVKRYEGPRKYGVERVPNGIRKIRLTRERKEISAQKRKGGNFFTTDLSVPHDRMVEQLPAADLYNLHWVSMFLSYPAFFPEMARRGTPLAWTLHDMNPFTGGCHYDGGCGKFASSCGACPELSSSVEADLSREVHARKMRSLAGLRDDQLQIVCLSEWMKREVERSSLLGRFATHMIPNSLNTDVFAPWDKATSRAMHGLPQDAKIVLFVAEVADSARKGFDELNKAVAELEAKREEERFFVVSIGRNKPRLTARIRHIHLGSISNTRHLALAYSAADLFVIPSLQDNLPNTVLEAHACGVPVVGFDVGGIPDMVVPGETGLLAPPGDTKAFGQAMLRLLLDDAARRRMGETARGRVVERNRPDVQAAAYQTLYESMLAKRSAASA